MLGRIEFEATPQNGYIQIPQEYQQSINHKVRVILEIDEQLSRKQQREDLIAWFLDNPIPLQEDAFKPMKREEIYHERESKRFR